MKILYTWLKCCSVVAVISTTTHTTTLKNDECVMYILCWFGVIIRVANRKVFRNRFLKNKPVSLTDIFRLMFFNKKTFKISPVAVVKKL